MNEWEINATMDGVWAVEMKECKVDTFEYFAHFSSLLLRPHGFYCLRFARSCRRTEKFCVFKCGPMDGTAEIILNCISLSLTPFQLAAISMSIAILRDNHFESEAYVFCRLLKKHSFFRSHVFISWFFNKLPCFMTLIMWFCRKFYCRFCKFTE